MIPHNKAQDLAIEAHDLVKVFGDHRAVDRLSLAVPTGSITLLDEENPACAAPAGATTFGG